MGVIFRGAPAYDVQKITGGLPICPTNLFPTKICGNNFSKFCVKGIKADKKRIKSYLDNSLMLVTALSPKVGYDNAAKIAKKAHKEGLTLKEAALKLKLVSEKDFDKWVDPKKMIGK